MKIHHAAQNSLDWLVARSGIPTASEWDAILTPEFKVRSGETPKSYLARKVAEAWIGGPLPGFQTIDMDFGHILEDEAIPSYELETGQKVKRVGLCTNDEGTVGCSPDGLIGDDCGIEVKCPHAETHVRYLLNGCVPKEYLVQVHGAMFVTGRARWVFYSYRRHFPSLIITVERNDDIQRAISGALVGFLAEFNSALKRLETINGGPPKRKTETPKPPKREIEDIYA